MSAMLEFLVILAAIVMLFLGFGVGMYVMVRAFQLVISLALIVRQNLGVFAESDMARDMERARFMGALGRRPQRGASPSDVPDEPPPAPSWTDDEILRAVRAGRPVATTGDFFVPGVDAPPPAANHGEAYVPETDGDRDAEPVPGGGGGFYGNGQAT